MTRPAARLNLSWPTGLVIFGMLAYTLILSYWSIGRAQNFNAGWYDLGIMTQTVWRTGHGLGFSFTNPEAGANGAHGVNTPRTAIHTDYLLALLAPLSWFEGQTAWLLLVVQSSVLALGAWFIYRIARKLLGYPWLGVLAAWVWLLYPPLHFANLFEFHAVTLAATFLLGAVDAILYSRDRAFWIWAALALISKEQVGITLGLLAGVLYLWQGQRRKALWAAGVAWGWALIQIFVVIPLSRPAQAGSFVIGKFYGSVGDDPGSVLKILLHPREVWERLATRTHLNDIVQLLTPLGYVIPLFGPIIVLIAPEMLLYWLSDSPNQQTLFLHYQALFIPILFLGWIFGLRWLLRQVSRWPGAKKAALVVLIGLTVLGSAQATLRFSIWQWSPITRWPLVAWKERLAPQVGEALALVPAEASVATTQNLGVQLAERPTVQLLPTGASTADYIVILERKFDPAIATNDKRRAEQTMLEALIPWLQADLNVTQRYHHDRVWVFERRAAATATEPVWPDGLLGY